MIHMQSLIDDTPPERQRDLGKACSRHVDDLTDTIVAGHQQPLRVWMVCLYVRGLHLSNAPMAKARDLQPADVQQRTCPWRHGMVAKPPSPTVSHEVEGDEVSIVAGHQGTPADVAKQGVAVDAAGPGAHADGAPSQPRNHRASA